MFKFWLKDPSARIERRFHLFVEGDGAGDGAGGGSGAGAADKPGAFDPVAFKAELLGDLRKDLNGIAKSLKTDFTKALEGLKPAPAAGGGSGDGGSGGGSGDGAGGDDGGAGDKAGKGGKGADPEKNALLLEIKKIRQESNDRIKALEDENKTTKARAEQEAQGSALREALDGFEFMSPEAKNTAISILKPAIVRADDGSFVAGELPLKKFVETELLSKHAYLIKGKDVGGANARPGNAGSGGKKYDLNEVLKPENFNKLSSAEQAAVRLQVANS